MRKQIKCTKCGWVNSYYINRHQEEAVNCVMSKEILKAMRSFHCDNCGSSIDPEDTTDLNEDKKPGIKCVETKQDHRIIERINDIEEYIKHNDEDWYKWLTTKEEMEKTEENKNQLK